MIDHQPIIISYHHHLSVSRWRIGIDYAVGGSPLTTDKQQFTIIQWILFQDQGLPTIAQRQWQIVNNWSSPFQLVTPHTISSPSVPQQFPSSSPVPQQSTWSTNWLGKQCLVHLSTCADQSCGRSRSCGGRDGAPGVERLSKGWMVMGWPWWTTKGWNHG